MKKKNFEEFSMIMNDNSAIDAPKQEGAVTMPTVPMPNGAIESKPNMPQVPNGAIGGGAVGAGLNLPPVPTQGFSRILESFNKRIGTQPPYANNQFNLGSGTVAPMQPSTPDTGTVTHPIVSGAVTGVQAATQIVPPDVENPVISGAETPTVGGADKLDYDAWRAEYGIDTDAEFNAAKAQLEYEMATWRENYGANAERLAQMGLSNSGVVDIYGTGVIQAYAQSMNDLFLAKIDAENAQLDRYKAYSDEYENKKAQATEAKKTAINQAYDYGRGLYNGENLEAVRTMIANAGYAPDEVEAAVARLQALDPSMIPALQEQAAADKQNVQTAFNSLAANYTPEQADGLRKIYGEGMGWSEESVNSLISMLNGYAETKSVTEEASKPSEEQIISDAASRLLLNVFTDEEGNVIYSGSQTQKNHIRQLMALSEYKDLAPYVDQIIAQMDADYASRKSAAATDTASNIEKIDTKNITFDAIGQELDAAALQYGADSEEYKTVETAIGNKTYEAFNRAMNDTIYFDAAYNLVGVSAEEWAEISKEDKMDKIINRAGEALDDGYITKDKFYSLITDAVTSTGRDYDDIVKWSNVHLKLNDYVEAGWLKDYEVQGLDYKLMNGIKLESVQKTVDSKTVGATVLLDTSDGAIRFDVTSQHKDKEKIFGDKSKAQTNAVMNVGESGKIAVYDGSIYLLAADGSAFKVNYIEKIEGTSTAGSNDNKNAVYQMLINYVTQKKTWG